jgi:biotin synthase-related radical SAM superfamily protein
MEKQKEVALKVFDEISEKWCLDEEEKNLLLGDTKDQIIRISHMMSIYRALHTIYEDKDRANAWIKKPNRRFCGRPAIEAIIEDPQQVQKYLEAQL